MILYVQDKTECSTHLIETLLEIITHHELHHSEAELVS